MRRLTEVLDGKESNYILPFFWQRGEEEEVLREEMARIHASGIRAVCVEARPHPDFLGPKWWSDFDIVMDEARSRGMRVWVLDDDHFPTGRAAGKLVDAPRELKRLFLSERHIDALGPAPHASFIIESPAQAYYGLGESKLVAVIAYRRHDHTGELSDECIDLTSRVRDGVLHWAVPAGYWRLFILTESDKGGSKKQEDYLNPLVAESTRVLIDTVHEAFYARYRADFGASLAGFFSDEPGFYNDANPYDFESLPGKKNVALPWSKDVPVRLEEAIGPDYRLQLPLLWHEQGTVSPSIRYHFMNIVSSLYAANFTDQIGNWCRERDVEYIGHVIEDNNVHARLGAGAGHFFRALGGQDMSGIDVVLWQLAPGFDELPFKWLAGETDSEFFNYGLGKMASSLAHLDPKKRGRTVAEVFGAYGWAEGLQLMKWLTDHMLVRGVNYFVPHAFSAREFPDPDCPPHLYARGKNPQFRYYRYLNHYTNRLSHLLSGGSHVASAAVLYHAEAEWSGAFMYFHKPVKELMRRQIDCDVLPIDALLQSAEVAGGKLIMGEESFHCLIVPYSEALPASFMARLADWCERGLPIVFVDGLPCRSSGGEEISSLLARLDASGQSQVVALHELGEHLLARGFREIVVDGDQPYLRHYHIRHRNGDVYFFFNEHPQTEIDTFVELPAAGRLCFYDAYDNIIFGTAESDNEGTARLQLKLAPFESICVVSGVQDRLEEAPRPDVSSGRWIEPQLSWQLSLASSQQYPEFAGYGALEKLEDLSQPTMLPRFSGTFRYESELQWEEGADGTVWMDLGEVYETAEVFVNDISAGVRISYPYMFSIGDLLKQGGNRIAIEVTNTLVKEQRDMFSVIVRQDPSGLLGPVRMMVPQTV